MQDDVVLGYPPADGHWSRALEDWHGGDTLQSFVRTLYGEAYVDGYYGERKKLPPNVLEDRELSTLLFDLLGLVNEHGLMTYECEITEEDYAAYRKAFKDKWLKSDSERVKSVIDSSVDDLRAELYHTYGIDE